MFQGQGKQLNVDRRQIQGPDGRIVDYCQFSFDHGNRMYSDYMRMLFTREEIASFIGNDDPKEEALGDCIEICLGILRVALMYEDCGADLFNWGNTMEILTGLESSLLVFNASAYPSGLKNRKMNNERGKGSYTYNDCLNLPVDGIPNRKFPIVIDGLEVPEDDKMDTAIGSATDAEGKDVSSAAPGTEAPSGGPFVPSGEDASKRRRLTPQGQIGRLYEAASAISNILTYRGACANCLSTNHRTERCTEEAGPRWVDMLITVRGGMEERHLSVDEDMMGDPEALPSNQPQDVIMEEEVIEIPEFATPKPESRSGVISYHNESKSLEEIVGEKEIRSIDAGGKDPTTIGFRIQEQLFDVLHKHIIETEYIPQRGHIPRIDQERMVRYSNWTNDFTYGRAEPLGYQMAYFADPALKKGGGFNHRQMQYYTRRWNNVLRHSIGQFGKPAKCDELGWVSIEEFIRNDHAWPIEDEKAWDHQNREYRSEVLKVRREILMEGYWYTVYVELPPN